MNNRLCENTELFKWVQDTQGLLTTPIFFKLGFKKRMMYVSKTSEIEKNYKKAIKHVGDLGFKKNELLRMIRIIENTYSPLTDIILPIISFFSGGMLTILFGEFVLRLIYGEPVSILINNVLILVLSLFMILILISSLVFKIRYESLKGKSLVILYEVIDQMEFIEERRRKKYKNLLVRY